MQLILDSQKLGGERGVSHSTGKRAKSGADGSLVLKASYDSDLCRAGVRLSHSCEPVYKGNCLNLSEVGLGIVNFILLLDRLLPLLLC